MTPCEFVCYLEMTGADVANIIPVIDILGSRGQKSLEVLHAGHPAVFPLELIPGKRTLDVNGIGTRHQGGHQTVL